MGAARALSALLLVGLVAAGCGGSHHAAVAPKPPPVKNTLRGLIPKPLPQKPSFTLTSTTGQPFQFAADTRGKLTYLYFGYTHCPDACPATMSQIAAALRLQRPAVRRRIAVVFVTVDPRRDTPSVLRAWLDHYSRSFIGLTGTPAQIQAAERLAGVPIPPKQKESGLNYSVVHSSMVLPYSPDNRAHVLYTTGFRPSDYAHDMPYLLRF
jgi:protein SCO1